MSSLRTRARVSLAIAVTLLLGFIVPPTVSLKHFRGLLSQSLSRSLDREVSVQDVRLRLLPLPGFTFRQLRISDDEEFGGEPILQTQEEDGQSSATLRLTSLWRGRLEIASVSLTQASLNLVRAPDGHWNLERLINRAAEVPSAPTSKKKPEARSRFPYIELKESRINFKFGSEKKPFALSESEFALWLAAENRWNVRLKAVPLRTDGSISDTGIINLSGSFDRAIQFAQTPFHFQVSWERSEIAAITRIVRGNDPGWRGAVDLSGELKGTPADFRAHLTTNITELRRYDVARNTSFDLRISCDQRFTSDGKLGDDSNRVGFNCKVPLNPGAITAEGSVHLVPGSPEFSSRIFASEVPVNTLLQAAVHAKSTLPADLSGDGVIDGNWSINRTAASPIAWQGAIRATGAVVRAGVLGQALAFPSSVTLDFEPPAAQSSARATSKRPLPSQIGTTHAIVKPFTLDLGGEVRVSASFDAQGYRMNVSGPVDWQRLLQVARTIGLRPPPTDLQGSGVIDAQYFGEWQHFAPPRVSGQAQIKSALLSLRGFSEPLNVSAGTLKFDGPSFQAEKIAGAFPQSGLTFLGAFSGTRQCEQHIVCNVTFSIQTNELDVGALLAVLNGQSNGITLPFFNSGHRFDAKWLLEIPASGTIAAQHLIIRDVAMKSVSAQLLLNPGKLIVRHWTGDVFEGKHEGDWSFDFSSSRPAMTGSGSVRHARMGLVRAAFDEQSGSGLLDLDYRVGMAGNNLDELASSASGSGVFSWHNGAIETLSPDADVPVAVRFGNWSGHFTIDKKNISLQNSRMDSSSGAQVVTGDITFSRQWNLKFVQADGSGALDKSGLESPVVLNRPAGLPEARR